MFSFFFFNLNVGFTKIDQSIIWRTSCVGWRRNLWEVALQNGSNKIVMAHNPVCVGQTGHPSQNVKIGEALKRGHRNKSMAFCLELFLVVFTKSSIFPDLIPSFLSSFLFLTLFWIFFVYNSLFYFTVFYYLFFPVFLLLNQIFSFPLSFLFVFSFSYIF